MLPVNIFPTASNIAMFLNGVHVELAYGMQYKESSPKIPVYGYNDYTYSKAMQGKSLVQGAMILQFVFPGYLAAVMNRSTPNYNPKLYNYDLGPIASDAGLSMDRKLKKYITDELPPNGSIQDKQARAEFIASLMSNKDPIKKQSFKKALAKHFSGEPDEASVIKKEESIITNPLSTSYINNGNSNTIDIYYQDPEFATFFTRFLNVEFTEVSQQASQAGAEGSAEPLYLIYQFISSEVQTKIIKNK